MEALKVLVLDDEERLAAEIAEYLENSGFRVLCADRPSTAFNLIRAELPDLALIDIKLPEYDGLTFLRKLREHHPNVEAVMMSGHGDMDSVIEGFRLGAFDYLRKPFSTFELQAAIGRTRRYLEARAGSRRFAQLVSDLNRELAESGDMIGPSSAMAGVREGISRAASHPDTPVLIHGESGTGKELAARNIHALSVRSTGRFVAVNCAAIPRDMFESEFFGHARGAFTGACGERAGLFRSADRGTLFLDEVAEVPPQLQAKLLRVLDDGRVRPVGEDSESTVDVRVLCATNRDLLGEVRAGRFRGDLYYRLAVVEILLPPLRERREDIAPLARLFLDRFCLRSGLPQRTLGQAAMACLSAYDFPGNVRELRNLVERIGILGRDPTDTELCLWLDPGCEECRPRSSSPPQVVDEPLDLESLEAEAIRRALARVGGVRAAAARLLGISRQALERRMERHGMR